MASIFELAVTSDLQYNTTLGYTVGDSGIGPAQSVYGSVRTGLPPMTAQITMDEPWQVSARANTVWCVKDLRPSNS